MNWLQAFILGVVEGLTEFLPISSTAHLIIFSRLLKIPQTEFQKFFEVLIQSGAIMAVGVIYFQYLLKNKKIILKITTSFFPTAVVGYLFYKLIKQYFFSVDYLMIVAFITVAFGFILVEQLVRKKKINLTQSISRLDYIQALIVGLAQSLAVVPGVSRAGIVLLVMMIMRYKRTAAAEYSFLLAVPTILAAGGYDLYKSKQFGVISPEVMPLLVIGLVTSFISAYFVIRLFIRFLQRNDLIPFAVYRIILALFLVLIMLY